MRVGALAEELGVGVETVYGWMHRYGLPHFKPPKSGYRIERGEFERWFQKYKSKVRTKRIVYARG